MAFKNSFTPPPGIDQLDPLHMPVVLGKTMHIVDVCLATYGRRRSCLLDVYFRVVPRFRRTLSSMLESSQAL